MMTCSLHLLYGKIKDPLYVFAEKIQTLHFANCNNSKDDVVAYCLWPYYKHQAIQAYQPNCHWVNSPNKFQSATSPT